MYFQETLETHLHVEMYSIFPALLQVQCVEWWQSDFSFLLFFSELLGGVRGVASVAVCAVAIIYVYIFISIRIFISCLRFFGGETFRQSSWRG